MPSGGGSSGFNGGTVTRTVEVTPPGPSTNGFIADGAVGSDATFADSFIGNDEHGNATLSVSYNGDTAHWVRAGLGAAFLVRSIDANGNSQGDLLLLDHDNARCLLAAGSSAAGAYVTLSDWAGTHIVRVENTGKLGFYGHATIAQQTGVAVTAAAIHAALVALGLITA